MTQPNSSQLTAIHDQLLDSLCRIAPPNTAEGSLHGADPDFVARLARSLPLPTNALHAAAAPLFTSWFPDGSTGASHRLRGAVEALTDLQDGEAHAVRRCMGFEDHWFAVRVGDEVVQVLSTGPTLTRLPDAGELAALVSATGQTEENIQAALAALPPLNEEALAQQLQLWEGLAATTGQAMAYHLRTRELTAQVVESERTRSLGTLSSGISHHFNGLLSVILGYASYILNREDLHPETKAALTQITEAAQRGRRLTEELLSFAGSDAQDEMICRVHDSMENVISLLESQGGGKLTIQRRFEAPDQRILSLPSDIHQIVFNLLTLAIDRGGKKPAITVTTENLELAPGEGPRFLRIDVAPSGPIPEGGHPALDAVDVEQQNLRTSSLYSMVRRLDGTVVVGASGHPGHIEIVLPVTDEPDSAPAPTLPSPSRTVASTIWVVDDDSLFREMCVQVLSEEGHRVSEFGDGLAMQNAFSETADRPDLFILDFSMPDINGFDLRVWIKEKGSSMPVVLVSGLAPNQPDIKKALKMRKTYFLQKPFSFRELADMASIAMGETLIGE